MDKVKELNTLLEEINWKGVELVNGLLKNIVEKDLLQMYSQLSEKAIENFYSSIELVELDLDSKEHFIYYYYTEKLNRNANYQSLILILNQLIKDYEKYKFLALNSVAVTIVKQNLLKDQEINKIIDAFKSKIINKEVKKLRYKIYIEAEGLLDAVNVDELLDLEAFEIIDYAMDVNRIKFNGLKKLDKPELNVRNRKKKMNLYLKAQTLIKKINQT